MTEPLSTQPFLRCIDDVTYPTKIQKSQFLPTGKFPIISQEENFINGYWNDEAALFRVKRPVVVFGDHTKVVKYIDFDFVLGADGVKVLQPKTFLEPRFFYYWLKSLTLDSLGYARHYKLLKEQSVPLPHLSEQQRIVGILDVALESIAIARANTSKIIESLRNLFESYAYAVFSEGREPRVSRRLKDVCETITDGTHQTPTYSNSGFIFLSSRNVVSGTINWNNVKYIDAAQHAAMQKRVSPRLNDILLAKNGTTGVAALVDRGEPFDIYVSLALLRPKDTVLPRFLLHFVNSPVAKDQFNKRLKGSGVPNLHLEEIREVELSLPDALSDQSSIVEQLDRLSFETTVAINLAQRKLAALEELQQSLLQAAFRGGM